MARAASRGTKSSGPQCFMRSTSSPTSSPADVRNRRREFISCLLPSMSGSKQTDLYTEKCIVKDIGGEGWCGDGRKSDLETMILA